MQEPDDLYRVMVETSRDGIILTRLDGTILAANEAAAALGGYRHPGALVGTPVVDLFHVDDQARVRTMIDESIRGQPVRLIECRLRGENETMITELTLSVATDDMGKPTGLLNVVRDVTKRKQREEELKDQTLHDALTGLPNRLLFRDRLTQAIENARRTETQVGVLYIDLDHFKEANDRFGHDFADVLLQQTAHRMQQTVRASDTLARLGGDEFAAVLPRVDATGAAVTAGKLTDELGTSFHIVGNRITIGASIGIAVYPLHGGDATMVLHRADLAMYAAKRSRRPHLFWHPEQEGLLENPHLPASAPDLFAVPVDRRVLSLARIRRQLSQ